jgi:hypothetical protein
MAITSTSCGRRDALIRRHGSSLGIRHFVDELWKRLSSAIVLVLTCNIVGMDGRLNIEWKASSHRRFEDELKASFIR